MKGFYKIKPLLHTSQRIFENNSVIIHLYTTQVPLCSALFWVRNLLPTLLLTAYHCPLAVSPCHTFRSSSRCPWRHHFVCHIATQWVLFLSIASTLVGSPASPGALGSPFQREVPSTSLSLFPECSLRQTALLPSSSLSSLPLSRLIFLCLSPLSIGTPSDPFWRSIPCFPWRLLALPLQACPLAHIQGFSSVCFDLYQECRCSRGYSCF